MSSVTTQCVRVDAGPDARERALEALGLAQWEHAIPLQAERCKGTVFFTFLVGPSQEACERALYARKVRAAWGENKAARYARDERKTAL